jgi:hypothetical protein
MLPLHRNLFTLIGLLEFSSNWRRWSPPPPVTVNTDSLCDVTDTDIRHSSYVNCNKHLTERHTARWRPLLPRLFALPTRSQDAYELHYGRRLIDLWDFYRHSINPFIFCIQLYKKVDGGVFLRHRTSIWYFVAHCLVNQLGKLLFPLKRIMVLLSPGRELVGTIFK